MRVLLVAFVAAFLVSDAAAQSICVDRGVALRQLQQRYGESPTALGLASNGNVVELFTSKTGSWTIIVTRPSGTSCVVASGANWEQRPVAEGEGS